MQAPRPAGDPPLLRGREAEIAGYAAAGMSDKEIASKIGVSAETVGTYWKRSMERLGVHSRTQLVALLAQSEIQQLRREIARLRRTDDDEFDRTVTLTFRR